MNKLFKTIFASCMGNTVEFYSITLYGGLAQHLGKAFFPYSEQKTLMALGIFGASYIARPLGGWFLGQIADVHGRARILVWSIFLVGFSNLLVAFLPGYDVMGLTSVGLLLFFRVLQGVCLGAEYSGALTFGQEHVDGQEKVIIGGWISGSCFWGFALGLLFVQMADFLPEWGWRLGFIISALLTFIAVFIRRFLGETPEFLEAKSLKIISKPKLHFSEVMRVFVVSSMDGVSAYVLGTFSFIYLGEYLHMDKSLVIWMAMFFIFCTGFLCVGSAYIFQYFHPLKFIRFWLWVGTLVVPFAFTWVSENPSF